MLNVTAETFLSVTSAVVILVSGLRYIRSIFEKTELSLGTWVAWLGVGLLTLLGMWKTETVNPMQVVSVLLFVTIIGIALYLRKWEFTAFDLTCLGAACVGFTFFWYYMDTYPTIATILGVSISLVATIPTLCKVVKAPQKEDLTAHTLGATAGLLQLWAGLLKDGNWSIDRDLQPTGGLTIGVSILLCIALGQYLTRNQKT
jgi:hypothetical protein